MNHPIHSITAFSIEAPYTLRVTFEDGTTKTIGFEQVLRGELYGPLRNLALFNQVRIDPEVHTLVWPNGADFDPATLYDWPTYAPALIAQAQQWELAHHESSKSAL